MVDAVGQCNPMSCQLPRRMCEAARATGKRVGDARHAALAVEHGCTWVTRDADFHDYVPAGLRLEILRPD